MTNVFEITVTGESMWPVLVPGKQYTVYRDTEARVGDVVVAKNPSRPTETIVKQVGKISEKRYELHGTVSWSSNCTVSGEQILGVVLLPTS